MNMFNSQRLTLLQQKLFSYKKNDYQLDHYKQNNKKETTMEEIIAADFFRCLASKEITTLTFIKKRE